MRNVSLGGLFWWLHGVLFGDRTHGAQLECRSCGTSIHSPRQHCPECGADDLAGFDF